MGNHFLQNYKICKKIGSNFLQKNFHNKICKYFLRKNFQNKIDGIYEFF